MDDHEWIAQARKGWPRLDAVLTYAENLARMEMMHSTGGNDGAEHADRVTRHNLRLLIADLVAERDGTREHLSALTSAVETCDQKMSRLGDGEWVMLYQVKAGWWHKVLAIARGAMPINEG